MIRASVFHTGLIATSCLIALQAHGVESSSAIKDDWIDGQLEAVYALNRHLGELAIDTSVSNGVVRLTGVVRSDIDRNLAGELAKGIDGVVGVRNILLLAVPRRDAALRARAADSSIAVSIDDGGTRAATVRPQALHRPNTDDRRIEIATRGAVLTLSDAATGDVVRKMF